MGWLLTTILTQEIVHKKYLSHVICERFSKKFLCGNMLLGRDRGAGLRRKLLKDYHVKKTKIIVISYHHFFKVVPC